MDPGAWSYHRFAQGLALAAGLAATLPLVYQAARTAAALPAFFALIPGAATVYWLALYRLDLQRLLAEPERYLSPGLAESCRPRARAWWWWLAVTLAGGLVTLGAWVAGFLHPSLRPLAEPVALAGLLAAVGGGAALHRAGLPLFDHRHNAALQVTRLYLARRRPPG